MGQKIQPNSFRLGITKLWSARWFSNGTLKNRLEEDTLIRNVIKKKIGSAGIIEIVIERNAKDVRIVIKAARPGLIIGRGGKGIEELAALIKSELTKLYRKKGIKESTLPSINLVADDLKRGEIAAANVAQNIAADLERRMPYRRVIKKYLDSIIQNREAKGGKIQVKGRLNGAEIARKEWLAKGSLPLQTLRANIDFATATAYTTYGTIGIKVWIYKGDIFDDVC
ncbi:MAG: 30S ribosomal protein S3 [Patescibacteria group bacterium]